MISTNKTFNSLLKEIYSETGETEEVDNLIYVLGKETVNILRETKLWRSMLEEDHPRSKRINFSDLIGSSSVFSKILKTESTTTYPLPIVKSDEKET